MLGIYCRISKDREGQKSIEDQRKRGIEFAEKNSLAYDVYVDEGISGGGAIENRPEFSRLIEDVQQRKINAIYVYNQDRTAREETTWFGLANLVVEGNIDLYENGQRIDLNDPSVFMFRGIKASIDAYYKRRTSAGIKDALERNAKEGRVFAVLPYGYEKDPNTGLMIPFESEVKIIERIHEASLKGQGVDSIAEDLNDDNIVTRRGARWAGKTVNGIIENPVYKGQRRWGNKTYPCPAIVTPERWQEVYDNFKKRNKRQGRRTTHPILLKGLVKCGKCGHGYYGRTREPNENGYRKDHYYMCVSKRKGYTTCGNRSINIDVLDEIVWLQFERGALHERVIDHFKTSNNANKIAEIQKKIERNERLIKEQDAGLDRLYESVARGVLTDEDRVEKQRKKLEEKIHILKAERKNLNNKLNYHSKATKQDEILKELEGIKQFWDAVFNKENLKDIDAKSVRYSPTFEEKQSIINRYVESVGIYYEGDTFYIEIAYTIPDMENSVVHIKRDLKASTDLLGKKMPNNKRMITTWFHKKTKQKPERMTAEQRQEYLQQFMTLKESVILPT